MPIDQIVKEATHLPDEYVAMAVSYIQFLQAQANAENKKERKLGILSDRFEFMADDFNAPLNEFREYM